MRAPIYDKTRQCLLIDGTEIEVCGLHYPLTSQEAGRILMSVLQGFYISKHSKLTLIKPVVVFDEDYGYFYIAADGISEKDEKDFRDELNKAANIVLDYLRKNGVLLT